jgi:hypothetical protein
LPGTRIVPPDLARRIAMTLAMAEAEKPSPVSLTDDQPDHDEHVH